MPYSHNAKNEHKFSNFGLSAEQIKEKKDLVGRYEIELDYEERWYNVTLFSTSTDEFVLKELYYKVFFLLKNKMNQKNHTFSDGLEVPWKCDVYIDFPNFDTNPSVKELLLKLGNGMIRENTMLGSKYKNKLWIDGSEFFQVYELLK
jgi:hypothetical protein